MSVIARKFRATPYRSAAETWKLIALLLAPDRTSAAYKELDSVCGIASSLVTSEAMKDAAVVCSGSGPRLRAGSWGQSPQLSGCAVAGPDGGR